MTFYKNMFEEGSNPLSALQFFSKLFLLALLCLGSLPGCGSQSVEGRVEDAKGAPLQGVLVRTAGSEKSVITDKEGRFSLPFAGKRVELNISGPAGSNWPAGCLPGPVTKEELAKGDFNIGSIRLPCFIEKKAEGKTAFISADGHWRVSRDGTTTDVNSHLMWQPDPDIKAPWSGVMRYCKILSFAGYNDWRLPERDELTDIITEPVKHSLHPFSKPRKSRYWSATREEGQQWNVYTVYDLNGASGKINKSSSFFARCVRQVKREGT